VFGTLIRVKDAVDATDKHWAQLGIVLALSSAVLLLCTHFLVDFGRLPDYADPKTEFDSYVVQVVSRAKWITITGFLSLLSLLPLLIIVFRVL
jgi:hypothetical protein